MKPYTANDLGCYIDGTFGHDHAHETIATLLGWKGRRPADCIDDYCSLDDDTELLDKHTEDGLYWLWYEGDLILTDQTEY